jgi:hypothetical protein
MSILSFLSNILPFPTSAVGMLAEDIDVIQKFADGDESEREHAIRVYRDNILTPGAKNLLCMQFMAEIDTPFPDPIQRSILRERLQKKAA